MFEYTNFDEPQICNHILSPDVLSLCYKFVDLESFIALHSVVPQLHLLVFCLVQLRALFVCVCTCVCLCMWSVLQMIIR